MTDAELTEMTSAELIQTIRQQEATIERLEARVAEQRCAPLTFGLYAQWNVSDKTTRPTQIAQIE